MRILVAVVVAGVLSGCTHYVPVQSPVGDRLWLVSEDGREVIRCWDTTPDVKPYAGGVRVFCKPAESYRTYDLPPAETPQGQSTIK